MAAKYDFGKIEKKWQKRWREDRLYEPDLKNAKRPFYNLMMFPYPSAEGLHVGNMYAFTGADIYGRMKRMEGYDVFQPIGLDGFGIHSENYALKIGAHPMEQAKVSERRFYEQLRMIGNGFAWNEKLETYDPEYYKWTQWIFVEMFKHGLVYRAKAPVNWCSSCKTVLADEQVILRAAKNDPEQMRGMGVCERCETPVIKKELEQWFFRITEYAEKLLENLDKIDWSERVKIAQRNWIGKSGGAKIDFPLNLPQFTGEVVFATNNVGKMKRMQKLFAAAGLKVTLKMPKEVGIEQNDVVEDGATLRENAERKASQIAKKTALPVLADDSGFFINGAEIDPVTVKRNALAGTDEKTLTIEEIAELMQKYYKNIASSYGGKVEAEWRNALCFVRPDKKTVCVEAVRPVILTNESHGKVDPYLPLRGLYISKATGKYVLEQTEAEEIQELQPIIDGVERIFNPTIKVFTTRPDTLFGATYVVLSPEHELLPDIKNRVSNWPEIEKYIKKARSRPESERIAGGKEKTGVELKGVKARNPVNEEEVPIFVADYVLSSYGTGAIMAVPAHDERDFEFAKKFRLPIIKVIEPPRIVPEPVPGQAVPDTKVVSDCWTGEGELVNSGKFDGMNSEKARAAITKFAGGKSETRYRLRDWLISRQRYWGVPIPMIYCDSCSWQPVKEEDLPVKLPFVKDFKPKGKNESPLASVKSFYETKCSKCGGKARRETDVSDTFLDSAWYYLRYPSVEEKNAPWNEGTTKKWLPVSLYTGGAEHSVLHLLYVRFLSLALHDKRLLEFGKSNGPKGEPFPKFRAHGLIIREGAKMSKSKGNVVNPDEYVKRFGADTLRMYLMFLAPFEQGGDFRDAGILGIARFLERLWKLFSNISTSDVNNVELERLVHKTTKKVTEDIENLHYNTAISALMILLNAMEKNKDSLLVVHNSLFLKLLAPFAPHIAEELWEKSGNKTSIHLEPWPEYDPRLVEEETFELVVQINGKTRVTVSAQKGLSRKEAEEAALGIAKISEILGGKKPKKVIFVPDRLINFVV
ncbi:hypothetical protein A2116_02295 [Candidatus Jorgensenbacteria bacterium GWA1_49_17]|uniref:Leucine--tRNA ligase n=2 Tax=Candidatus Joergenseniibacteriota TaxID=1752739 RepID=A0A1F6BTG6_9BACT|nr:MAG: hypothetical protein A2116_02295 [Candidatus Jorgensenbacteria bacterium GWA1_49_17]